MKYTTEGEQVRLEMRKRHFVWLLAAEACCWILGLSLVGWGFWQHHEVTRLQEENMVHQRQLEVANRKMMEMEERLAKLDALDAEIRSMMQGSAQGATPAGDGRTIEQRPLAATPITPRQLLGRMADWERRSGERLVSLSMLQMAIRDGADLNRFPAGVPDVDGEKTTPSIWPANGRVSDSYGWRKDPFSGEMAFHEGIDIAGDYGSPVIVTAKGRVTRSEWVAGYGNLVEVEHRGGIVTRYGHNSVNMVKAGDEVHGGQVIAFMGSTGRSTGSHVHYEVRVNGTAVNPQIFLPAQMPRLLE